MSAAINEGYAGVRSRGTDKPEPTEPAMTDAEASRSSRSCVGKCGKPLPSSAGQRAP